MCATRLTAIRHHAEAIEIIFDPAKVSYRQISNFLQFMTEHAQSPGERPPDELRSAIFYTNDEQKRIAEDTIADVVLRICRAKRG